MENELLMMLIAVIGRRQELTNRRCSSTVRMREEPCHLRVSYLY